MKLRIEYAAAAFALFVVLGGCAKKDDTAQNQTPEQKVAEAEKKAAEAGAELEKARAAAAQGGEAASQSGQKAAGSGWSQGAGGAAPAAPAPPKTYTVASGTALKVRTITSLSTKTATNGTPFEASLDQPLVVDGYTVAARGANVAGVVAQSDPGGKVKGVASLTLRLTSIQAGGQMMKIDTSGYTQLANSSKKKDAAKIGIGAGVGAAIGAIAGGGKGAAIGAGIGGGAGTGAVLLTKGDPAVLPSESLVTFKLQAPITVTAAK